MGWGEMPMQGVWSKTPMQKYYMVYEGQNAHVRQKARMWGKRPMGVLPHFAHIYVETIMLSLKLF